MRQFCVFLLILLSSFSAAAAERLWASTVKFVYPQGNGDVVIGLDNDNEYCTATTAPKYMYVRAGQNGATSEGVKNILAAAMMAFATGKQLSIAFDDATSSCYINRAKVSN